MKKIVILVDQLNSHGGIERLVAIKANYWATVFNYDVTIISTEQHNKPLIYELSNQVKFVDLAVNYQREKSYFSIGNVLKFVSNIFQIQRYILKQNPDFIIVASHIPITYFLPFLYRKAKISKEFHFSKFRINNSGFKQKVLNFIESKYDSLIVLSQEEKDFYVSKNAVVIPNPIENQIIDNGFDIVKNQNIAVAVGRFAPVKRLEKMVEIWSQFSVTNPNWKLHIFGTVGNEYYKEIEQLVIKKNLQEVILFKGQSNTIEEEISKAKILLMTSEQECFPMVILEANSVGIPVISFDCPTGPRNIIHHNVDGILVEHNNINNFVNELIRFDSDENLQKKLSNNSKENAKKYSLELIMKQWDELIFKAND
ncbi:glycosyltransferase family 4 protein [Flavobacterium sp.]|uniref:glycosyltransferase family 4 protein n=1 Tax=Flavobacterium sp. TaxID=239 RepID=UPI0026308B7D|nr:glycosyltransferase family 4 protein [Flavobacterium sp.]